jgi:hypothetical protein
LYHRLRHRVGSWTLCRHSDSYEPRCDNLEELGTERNSGARWAQTMHSCVGTPKMVMFAKLGVGYRSGFYGWCTLGYIMESAGQSIAVELSSLLADGDTARGERRISARPKLPRIIRPFDLVVIGCATRQSSPRLRTIQIKCRQAATTYSLVFCRKGVKDLVTVAACLASRALPERSG